MKEIQIINIEKSSRKTKRYRVILNNGDSYDFGLLTGKTYIDHHDKIKRSNYLKRHMGNDKEKELIDELIPSPALFSAYLLWGSSTSLDKNIDILNKLFMNK